MTVKTLAFHVSEKPNPEFLVHTPSPMDVYMRLLKAVKRVHGDGKKPDVVLMPEYDAHNSWAAEAAWLIEKFKGIPIMLDAAGGWDYDEFATPERIQILLDAGVNITWIRISELISYYDEWLHLPFPQSYFSNLLDFCKTKNIKVYYCEWKTSTLPTMLTVVAGYEDIVTLGFKTNSGDMEPAQMFKLMVDTLRSQSPEYPYPNQWGATIESWYWETRHRQDSAHPEANVYNPDNMPVSYMIIHTQEAVSMPTIWYAGAELIQYEAYWWFFEHTTGKPRRAFNTVMQYFTSGVAIPPIQTIVMETLYAEWIGGPLRGEIKWFDGRGEDAQPSKKDFTAMPERYAIKVSSLRDEGSRWLRTELINVECIAKKTGVALDDAIFQREHMRNEVERIIFMYSRLGALYNAATDLTPGQRHKRHLPGVLDVYVSGISGRFEDESAVRVNIQIKCQYQPKKLWVVKND